MAVTAWAGGARRAHRWLAWRTNGRARWQDFWSPRVLGFASVLLHENRTHPLTLARVRVLAFVFM
eukprot:1195575-Prorocentrum_minimum.AAC.7